jgi:ABC-type uncharacterized transport system involved in gliding motility auxiliary subunit
MKINWKKHGPTVGLILSLVAALAAAGLYIVQQSFTLQVQISLGVIVLGLLLAVVFNPQKAREVLSGRQAKYTSNALLVIVATLGIIVITNYILHRYDQRWDLTEDQNFSLTKETLAVLDGLQQPVKVEAFFTTQANPATAKNLLDTYKYYGKGKFDFEIVDPNANVIRAQQAKITRDGTIVFTMGDHTEQVTSVTEEDFTSAILRLTNPGKRNIVFLTGHGEPGFDTQANLSFSQLNASLTAKNYTVSTLNLLSDPKIPDQTLAIVVAGPLVNLSDGEIKLIQAYLNSGGGLIYLSDPPYFTKNPGQPNAFDQYITQNWGIAFGNNIIVDPDVQPPSVTYAKTLGTHPITSKLNNLAVFFPSAHSISPAATKLDNITQTVLVQTSENAWGETDLVNLDKTVSFDANSDLKGPVSIAIAATDQKSNAKIVVIGDVVFATDKSFQSYSNSDFIINSIDWAAKQDNLLNLTPKNVTNRSLIPPQGFTIGLILLVVVFIIPGLVIVMGIANWFQRRSKA